ncbi:phage shock protein A [Peribacillus deserti]|uniref:Phage shock protein A n=1 Tax=Peribacillus deserti TaxID=673318 RepID=A0ABS2QDP2_9BACI|nr:PspA/IM30 family protein [Peribacillus deserti]MBM7690929.1 phage shock protein A [Peribacillus deserti]
MGLFKRMKSITMAELNGVLDRVEDPIAMLNQYVREMEDDLAKGQEALSRQIFLEKKQNILITEAKALISKRERQAKLAVERGEDSMATLALQEKRIHQNQLNLYVEQFEAIQQQTESLYEKLHELKGKYNELLHKRILLSSRANVAQSIKQIQKTTVSFSSETIAKGISRVEERILLMEAEVQAFNQYPQPGNTAVRGYVDNSIKEELEEELQKLKQDLSKETA